MRSAIVTGAGGFLGSAVGRCFSRQKWSVIGLGSSVDTTASWDAFYPLMLPNPRLTELLSIHQPDVLIHCVGSASVPSSFTAPDRDFVASPVVLQELLEQVRRVSPRSRVIFLSSAAVYGSPRQLPISEQDELNPESPYGFHKRMCEELCEEYSRFFGIQTAVVRIFSAYGPGLRRQVVWDICEKALRESEVLLQGTGEESRDFVYVDDAAAALLRIAMQAECVGEAYNLASGIETNIEELAKLIVSRLAPGKRIRFSGQKPQGMPQRWRADISSLHKLDFQNMYSFEAGLDKTLAWYQQEVAEICRRQSA